MPGERFTYLLTREGTIPYVCTPHHGMFGNLIVGPKLSTRAIEGATRRRFWHKNGPPDAS